MEFFPNEQHIAPSDLDVANLTGVPFLIILFLFDRSLLLLRFLDLPTHALWIMFLMKIGRRITHPTNVILTLLRYENMADPFILIGEEEVEGLS